MLGCLLLDPDSALNPGRALERSKPWCPVCGPTPTGSMVLRWQPSDAGTSVHTFLEMAASLEVRSCLVYLLEYGSILVHAPLEVALYGCLMGAMPYPVVVAMVVAVVVLYGVARALPGHHRASLRILALRQATTTTSSSAVDRPHGMPHAAAGGVPLTSTTHRTGRRQLPCGLPCAVLQLFRDALARCCYLAWVYLFPAVQRPGDVCMRGSWLHEASGVGAFATAPLAKHISGEAAQVGR